MRTVGIVVEYNPFHNGHRYHLEQSVRVTGADAVVAVMSGHWLQRGEPALANKWARTEMALSGGCDLVIEIPVAYATNAAEWFAFGAASLLDATGVVDAISFGSESGDIGMLRRIAAILAHEPPQLQQMIRDALASGASYPAAFSSAVRGYLAAAGDGEAAEFPLEQPNNTLGLHYMIALKRLGSAIEPYTIRREKAGYSQRDVTDGAIASATALRRLIAESGDPGSISAYVPNATLELVRREWQAGRAPLGWPAFADKLFHALAVSDTASLAEFRDIGEGLEHRIKQALPRLARLDFDSLIDAVKTKRYTRTRLQRALLSVLLGHHKAELAPDRLSRGIEYIRVLGFTAKGRTLLKRMRATAKLPVLLSAANPPIASRYLELDTQASAAYALGYAEANPRDLFRDYLEAPVIR
jgi:predicted nucleotidyltransferase